MLYCIGVYINSQTIYTSLDLLSLLDGLVPPSKCHIAFVLELPQPSQQAEQGSDCGINMKLAVFKACIYTFDTKLIVFLFYDILDNNLCSHYSIMYLVHIHTYSIIVHHITTHFFHMSRCD